MTVEKIKRSQSMWSMSTSKYPVQRLSIPARSPSVVSASNWSLSDSSPSSRSVISRFRKRSRDKQLQTIRYSSGPCLCGDVDAVDSNGRSLLFYSARYGQLDPAVQLVEAGCSPNQQDVLGNTPLHEAIEKGHLDIAEVFLKDGKTDVNVCGFNGETPLMASVTRGQLDAVKLLVRHGADVNACDAVDNPPIYRALQRGWNEIAEFLIDHQCDVNKTTANGMSCFFAAAHCNKIHIGNIARRLLKTDYDFKKDTEWLATEGCPVSIKDDPKHHNKLMVKARLQSPKKSSLLSSGKRKFVKTFRSLSKDSR
ncbi:histone-lysine N-methyltransferase EHMT1-like [Mercenaria mercenaria]|uniref:histone-lysine N-methyltransferase EHMT1-like n=1 Tax=Mercenaria mercenaria TaxID=6596 RepID=UPI00234E376E|nr:histone-lysine N-methyltransferase EHMT1-like [Mercenaria mercenaria]XP_053386180.1 histone-lysine N-methyltransferase EHMT1-like [Mercenaria mercenaria]